MGQRNQVLDILDGELILFYLTMIFCVDCLVKMIWFNIGVSMNSVRRKNNETKAKERLGLGTEQAKTYSNNHNISIADYIIALD